MSSYCTIENRNASLIVCEEPDGDVVPPFLTGEVAGSLKISSDRARLKEFALSLLDWLERTECEGDNVVRHIQFGSR